MRLAFLSASAGVLTVWAAPALSAQLASEIAALHRDGQTFVTWREAPQIGVRYRVYRSPVPILSEVKLRASDLLGEVDDKSSRNQERSQVERGERTWVIAEGAPPLGASQGLFVHTVEGDQAAVFYAVTSVKGGLENRTLASGRNATVVALSELAAPPLPVLQGREGSREVWGHWVGDRDTPYLPALSLTPSHAFDFAFEPGLASGPRGLLLRLHPAGGNYATGWPPRALVPQDVDVLAPSDLHPTTGYTFFFGAHERFPGQPEGSTRVWCFTQERLLWTLGWMSAHLGGALDAERVSVAGSSLGATGGMYLVEERPDLFSAALLRNGNFDLQAGDLDDIRVFEKLYGRFALDLPMRSGLTVLERTNARTMANLAPAVDWPVIRTLNGRADTRVGWASAVGLFAGLDETFRPSASYFDDHTHSSKGYWSPLERTLVQRTCQVRRDRPSLRFSACTLDDDAGNGSRTSGDTIGTLGGRVDYDPETAASAPGWVRFDVFVRDEGALDDAAIARGQAVLTPRRTGSFVPAPGESVYFTLREGADLLEEHWLLADELGLVHTPPVPLSTTRREARFELSP